MTTERHQVNRLYRLANQVRKLAGVSRRVPLEADETG